MSQGELYFTVDFDDFRFDCKKMLSREIYTSNSVHRESISDAAAAATSIADRLLAGLSQRAKEQDWRHPKTPSKYSYA